MVDFEEARRQMVQSQLLPNRIRDSRLLEVIAQVARERFVPDDLNSVAYIDEDLFLGRERYLMEPMVFAHLAQILRLGPSDIVLDVGCATGYSTVVLALLSGTVVSVESDDKFLSMARQIIADFAVGNAIAVQGPLRDGYPPQGPYDGILLNGSVEALPEYLTKQLADGGRLAAVITEPGERVGRLTLVTRHGDNLSWRTQLNASIPPLPGFEKEVNFVF